MVRILMVLGLQVVARLRFGICRCISETFNLLHIIGGLHLNQVFSHGNKSINPVLGQAMSSQGWNQFCYQTINCTKNKQCLRT